MWHYILNEKTSEAVDIATIKKLLETGVITNDTLVWTAGMNQWIPVSQTNIGAPALPKRITVDINNGSLHAQLARRKSSRTRTTYILLALFLGGFGVHNFYAGHVKIGILELALLLSGPCLAGIPWILLAVFILLEICTTTTDGSGLSFS
jgi:hypothetical protein